MFKIGQKVVCKYPDPYGYLVKGEIYEITNIFMSIQGIAVSLKDVYPDYSIGYGFRAYRFVPTNDTYAEYILCNIMSDVKEEELV